MKMRIYIFLFALVAAVTGVSAQQMPNVPLDPEVKVGVLPNGLTYYIRHNEWPEKRCDFLKYRYHSPFSYRAVSLFSLYSATYPGILAIEYSPPSCCSEKEADISRGLQTRSKMISTNWERNRVFCHI